MMMMMMMKAAIEVVKENRLGAHTPLEGCYQEEDQ
jgi:hypothetical protein